MDEQIEASAQTVMTDIVTDLSEHDWECQPMTRSDNADRFAFCYVTLPNGQTFKVVVEEMI